MPLLGALYAVREVVVSKFFDGVMEKLVSSVIDVLASSKYLQFPTETQIQEELQKLKEELQKIRALLDDAEKKQLKDQSVKLWLSNLLNLAYDVDDIVDELQTEISKRTSMLERQGSSSQKPRLSPDSVNTVISNSGMMSRIKVITAKLKDSEREKKNLQRTMKGSQEANRIKERQQSTSLEIETHVYGRDKDKEAILELVKSNDEGNFVIPIVGMGGIGKTTLAQGVYNDVTVKTHFDHRAWVCVSDFDVARITKAIYQFVFSNKSCDDKNWNLLQEELKEEFSKKNFLIVLDDVWDQNYNKWTNLQAPFLTRTPGSKIIVTTRSFDVSSTMSASPPHYLNVLSEDDCLSIITQHALGAKDFGGRTILKEVAVKIARKCKGLPLAAKTLGGLLRTNVDYDNWKKILESEIWKLSDHENNDIIPALQLSYHHLPLHLKRCFAYCSILPKDYEFEEKEIILLWRAEGLLQEARDKHSIEDLGHEYFRDLVSRSLLQKSNKDGSRFVMHDLINDLAQSVAGEICFRIEGDQKISKHARHMSYIAGRLDGIKKFKGINEAQQLRTYLPFWLSNDGVRSFVTNDVLTDLLPNLKCLRVVSLSNYYITELPDFWKDLIHLRYLDFSHTAISCLPESISTLYNLETLLLGHCENLKKLPSEMENLVNLCYLDLTGTFGLEDMLSNFETLSGLQTLSLSNFVLREGEGSQIGKLEGLSNLKGELCISELKNVVETQDAWKAKLHDKSRLDKLELKWRLRSEGFEYRRGEIEKDILDLLQPSKKLKELDVRYYCGVTFAKWMGDSSFANLLSLVLENCLYCTSLPSIGQLPSLKNACIVGLRRVTSVGVEFFGKNASNAFPKLERLEFRDMLEWDKWNFCEVDKEATKFPRLRNLLVVNCPKLLGSIPDNLPSLELLWIWYCKKLVILIQSLPVLSQLNICECQKVVLGSLEGFGDKRSLNMVFAKIFEITCTAEWLTSGSIKVKWLYINDCKYLCSFQENNWELLTQSMSLGSLSIAGEWPQLVSIGAEEEREESMQLKIPCSIQELAIDRCERLKKLPTTLQNVTSLTEISLDSCPALVSLSKNNLPLNLKSLEICSCDNLRCLFEEGENVSINNACALEKLIIQDCPSLISLSENNLPLNLKILRIIDCKKLLCLLEGGENVDISNASLLEELDIFKCPSLESLSSRGGLPSRLKELSIRSCRKLEYITQEIQDNCSLECIRIDLCRNIKCLPQGLNKLSHLRIIRIWDCSNLVSFPESGLPSSKLKVLSLESCEELQALPHGIHNLNCLEDLTIRGCSSVTSFPEEGIPTNLRKLTVGGPNICKPLIEWGLHRLTSLESLEISDGCPDALSFPQEEIGMMLPCSLTTLVIENFPKLEILSSKGFQGLTSLEMLKIIDCPNLKSLPKKDMLSSLLHLEAPGCPVLKELCEKHKGPEWSSIAHVPLLRYFSEEHDSDSYSSDSDSNSSE